MEVWAGFPIQTRCVLPKLRKYGTVFATERQPIEREGSLNPDKPAGPDVRFDLRTGRVEGLNLINRRGIGH